MFGDTFIDALRIGLQKIKIDIAIELFLLVGICLFIYQMYDCIPGPFCSFYGLHH